jgi:thiol-disulfide isomerase/thioredoxin
MKCLSFGIVLILVCAACAPVDTFPTSTPAAALLAPDFTATALTGEIYTLNALRGRWVILNFWATWCVPCVAEMPALQQIADTYEDTVVLLGINLRETIETVAPFVSKHELRFPILIQPDDVMLLNYQVVGLPQTLLISPSGEIVYRQFGPLALDTFGQELERRLLPGTR